MSVAEITKDLVLKLIEQNVFGGPTEKQVEQVCDSYKKIYDTIHKKVTNAVD